MESIGTPFLWLMFAGVVVVALLVDLVLMRHGGPHKVTFKEATWWSIASVVHSRDGDNRVAGRQLVWTSPIRVGWGAAHNRKRPAHGHSCSQQPCSYGPVSGQPASLTSERHQRHRPSPICLTGQQHHHPRTSTARATWTSTPANRHHPLLPSTTDTCIFR